MTIEFLAEYEDFDKSEFDEILNQLKDRKVDKNVVVLTTFTKALIMASRPKKVEIMPKAVALTQGQVIYQPLQKPLPPAPHPHIIKIVEKKEDVGGERPIILSKATNQVMASAKVNHSYQVTEPVMSDVELKMLDTLKKKFGKKLTKDDKFLEKKKGAFVKTVKNISKKFKVSYSDNVLDKVNYYLIRDVSNFGKIDPLIKDNEVESISCDSASEPVMVNCKDKRLETNIRFKDKKEMNAFVEELAKKAKKKISKKEPILDTTLGNLRIQATLGSDIVSSKFVIKRV